MTKADTIFKENIRKSWKKESGQSRRVLSTRMVERPTPSTSREPLWNSTLQRRVSYHHPSSHRD